ncbi:Unknown protein [Striga hermonthica]|uniref:Retrotransposon gag domain-containing protein n=1 Tax=Striga hermonthica TaxID=68872 RepID=A0A9N7NHQ4_STRHE|nr:Unknown protein [Striga hermonthica]
MRVEFRIKGQWGFIEGTEQKPQPDDQINLLKWEKEDMTVFSSILNNIEPQLMHNLAEYQTSRALWEALAVTYGAGTNSFQIYHLQNEAARRVQENQTLEAYWNDLQGLWLAIDRRRPNPMTGDNNITTYNKITQQNKLFNFLGGLNGDHDSIRREILREDPLPSVEAAYGKVRKEAAQR